MKTIAASTAALGIAVLLACLLKLHFASSTAGHATMATKTDMNNVLQALNVLSSYDPSGAWRQTLSNADASTLYSVLTTTNGRPRLLLPRRDWDSQKQLLDAWGNPLSVHVSFGDPSGGSNGTLLVRVTLRSVGPDGKDANGTGDDISSETMTLSLPK